MRFSVFVPDGSMLPRGYGRAWILWDRYATVAMPIPFNWFAGWLRRAYYFALASGPTSARRDYYLRQAYWKGGEDARAGFYRSVDEEVDRRIQRALTETLAERSRR